MRPVANDTTRCSVPCELAPECQRAAALPDGVTGSFAHFIGGQRCPGYLPYEACFSCALWKRDTAPEGVMPGVRADHRPCGRPRVSPAATEWRAPTDWCDQWSVRT